MVTDYGDISKLNDRSVSPASLLCCCPLGTIRDELQESVSNFQQLLSEPKSEMKQINLALNSPFTISLYGLLKSSKKFAPTAETFSIIFGKLSVRPHHPAISEQFQQWKTIFSDLVTSNELVRSGSSLLRSLQLIMIREESCGAEAFQLFQYLQSQTRQSQTRQSQQLQLNGMELMRFAEIFRLWG
jgi:hypothetical protein